MRSVVSILEWFVAGLFFGMLMTFGHQATVQVSGVSLPWGLVVALLGVSGVLVGFRLVAPRRTTGAVAVGIIAAVLVFSLPGPGGSVLVPANLPGLVWAIAPSLIALLVVFWPVSRPRQAGHPR